MGARAGAGVRRRPRFHLRRGELRRRLASLVAFTPNDPLLQPGFEEAETSVAGAVALYGYYGATASNATTDAPPCLVVHGDQDTLVVVDDARRFVEQLRATSSSPVVYAEVPGAQHGFDFFRSRRFDSVVDAIEAFAAHIRGSVASRTR